MTPPGLFSLLLLLLPGAHAWVPFPPVLIRSIKDCFAIGDADSAECQTAQTMMGITGEQSEDKLTPPIGGMPKLLSSIDHAQFRWDWPADATALDGLSGSLTYAIDPMFCSNMIGSFTEQKEGDKNLVWVDCNEITNSIARAFGTWQSNHKNLKFLDVSQECEIEYETRYKDMGREKWECPSAEIYITTKECRQFDDTQETCVDGDPDFYPALAAYVMPKTPLGMQVVRGDPAFAVRKTNGVQTDGFKLSKAIMYFQVSNTTDNPTNWYLDNTFCFKFHTLGDVQGIDGLMCARVLVFVMWSFAFLGFFAIVGEILYNQFKYYKKVAVEDQVRNAQRERKWQKEYETRKREGLEGMDLHLAEMSHQKNEAEYKLIHAKDVVLGAQEAFFKDFTKHGIFLWLFDTFFLLVPPMFYWRVFLPCYDGYDFEATFAHEIGHTLAFHHPDMEGDINMEALQARGSETCLDPFNEASVKIAMPDLQTEVGRNMIMTSVTVDRAKVCLGEDDVNGLHWLYPVCEGYVDLPLCTKPDRDMGYIRSFIYVIAPLLAIMLSITLLFSMFVHYHNKKMYKKKLVKLIPNVDKFLNLIGRRYNQRPSRSRIEFINYMCAKYDQQEIKRAIEVSIQRKIIRRDPDNTEIPHIPDDNPEAFPSLAVVRQPLPELPEEPMSPAKSPSRRFSNRPVKLDTVKPVMQGAGPLGAGIGTMTSSTMEAEEGEGEETMEGKDDVIMWLKEEDLEGIASLLIEQGVEDLKALEILEVDEVAGLSIVQKRKLKKAIEDYDWSDEDDPYAEVKVWLEEEDLSDVTDAVLNSGVQDLAGLQACKPDELEGVSVIQARKLQAAIDGYDWSETPRSAGGVASTSGTPRKEEEEEEL